MQRRDNAAPGGSPTGQAPSPPPPRRPARVTGTVGNQGLVATIKDLHPMVLLFASLGFLIAMYTLYLTLRDDPNVGSGPQKKIKTGGGPGSPSAIPPGGGPLGIPGLGRHRAPVAKMHEPEGTLIKETDDKNPQFLRGNMLHHLGEFSFFRGIQGFLFPSSRAVSAGTGEKKVGDAVPDGGKDDHSFVPDAVPRKWFPQAFAGSSASEYERGDHQLCTIPPLKTKDMSNTQKRSYRIVKTLSHSLYNPEMPLQLEGVGGADDMGGAAELKDKSAKKQEEAGGGGDEGGGHRIVYRQPLNEAVDLSLTMKNYYLARSIKEADQQAAYDTLKAKRAPHNPWVEARSTVSKHSSDVFSLWVKRKIRHYGDSALEAANTICNNLVDVKQIQKEEQWVMNKKLETVTSNVDALSRIYEEADRGAAAAAAAGGDNKDNNDENKGGNQPVGGKDKKDEELELQKKQLLGAAAGQALEQDVVDSLMHLRLQHNEAIVGGVGVKSSGDAPSPGATLAEQAALLSKVRVWDPVCSFQKMSEQASLREQELGNAAVQNALLNRPVLLCSVTTMFRKLRLAVLQHQLWGSQCDEFLIFVSDGHRHWDRKQKEAFEKELESMDTPLDSSRIIYLKANFGRVEEEEPVTLLGPNDDTLQWEEASLTERSNQWQTHREIINYLSTWHMTSEFDYFYFGNEDTYLIPENLYEMLTVNSEYKVLHELNTALLLGNRMVVPSTKQSFANAAAGYVLNSQALNFRTMLINNEECEPTAVSQNEDVLLAKCLGVLGVEARDTSDEFGQDRFTALNVEWLIRTSVDPTASWWYPGYRKRGLPGANGGDQDEDLVYSAAHQVGHGGKPAGGWSQYAYNAWSQYALYGGKYDPAAHVAAAAPSLSSSVITFAYVSSPARAVWLHENLFGVAK